MHGCMMRKNDGKLLHEGTGERIINAGWRQFRTFSASERPSLMLPIPNIIGQLPGLISRDIPALTRSPLILSV